jgi:hypothetical protein
MVSGVDMNYTDKQIALADALNEIVIRYGAFEAGDDANGCDYRDGEENVNHGGKCCAECIFFRGGGCAIVNGDIDAMGICRYWIITDQALEEGEYDDGLREEDGEDGQDGQANAEAEDPYEEEMKSVLTTAERNKLKDSDFVFPSERAFPIVDGSDVEDAVSSWGRYRGSESFDTFKKRLIALARRKDLEDKLPEVWKDEKKSFDFAIKAIGDDMYRGLGVVFGGKDLTKDEFTKHTDLGLERSPENIPVFFEHGLDDSGIGTAELRKPIGRVVKAEQDDVGVWFEFQLNKRSKYVERIKDLIHSGAVGLSTGALPHVVERENGQLKQWYIGELSITTHPAEPRTLVHTTPKVEAKADDESSESPRRPIVIFLKK